AVERGDDPVAIPPRLRLRLHVEGVRLVLRVAGHVEPVPRPLLAVLRGGEQSVDYLFERVRRVIGEERLDRFRGRRQTGEVVVRPADERPFVGGGGRLQPLFGPLRGDEAVDGGFRVPRNRRLF